MPGTEDLELEYNPKLNPEIGAVEIKSGQEEFERLVDQFTDELKNPDSELRSHPLVEKLMSATETVKDDLECASMLVEGLPLSKVERAAMASACSNVVFGTQLSGLLLNAGIGGQGFHTDHQFVPGRHPVTAITGMSITPDMEMPTGFKKASVVLEEVPEEYRDILMDVVYLRIGIDGKPMSDHPKPIFYKNERGVVCANASNFTKIAIDLDSVLEDKKHLLEGNKGYDRAIFEFGQALARAPEDSRATLTEGGVLISDNEGFIHARLGLYEEEYRAHTQDSERVVLAATHAVPAASPEKADSSKLDESRRVERTS